MILVREVHVHVKQALVSLKQMNELSAASRMSSLVSLATNSGNELLDHSIECYPGQFRHVTHYNSLSRTNLHDNMDGTLS